MNPPSWTPPGARGSVSFVLRGRASEAAMPAAVARALVEARGDDALVAQLGVALGGSLSEDLRALRRRVSEALGDGRLIVVREARRERVGGHAAPEAPVESAPTTRQAPTTTWITVRLVDEDDRPVGHARYRIKLPDGSEREGRLDANGVAHFDGIDPGNCELSWPDYDGAAWERRS